MSEALAEAGPADDAEDKRADEHHEGHDRRAAEEGPLDERPEVHLRVEHGAPANDIEHVQKEVPRHKQLLLAPDSEPAL